MVTSSHDNAPSVEPNEAYACPLKTNMAYERVIDHKASKRPKRENEIKLELNKAYESIIVSNKDKIYEEVLSTDSKL